MNEAPQRTTYQNIGLIVGIAEAMTAGYISSAYKDAVAFLIDLENEFAFCRHR